MRYIYSGALVGNLAVCVFGLGFGLAFGLELDLGIEIRSEEWLGASKLGYDMNGI